MDGKDDDTSVEGLVCVYVIQQKKQRMKSSRLRTSH